MINQFHKSNSLRFHEQLQKKTENKNVLHYMVVITLLL